MRRRTWWILGIVCVLVTLQLRFIQSQSEQTLATLLRLIYNPATQALMTTPWAGADGPELTPTAIFNAVVDQDGGFLRTSGAGGEEGSIVGITSSPTGVASIHYSTVTLTNTCGTLGTVSHVNVIAGPSGVTCTLPDPALLTTPGVYSIIIMDANEVTLSPSGTNLLNGVNASMPPVSGPLIRITVERRSATEWYADVDQELASTAVTPGAYGTASSVGTFTVDADGRLTTAATVPIVIGSGEVTDNALTGTDINESTLVLTGLIGPGEIASTAVTPGSYGTASSVGTFTVDADGRLTAAATVPIVIGSSGVTDNALTGTDINESTLVLTGLVGPGELASTAVTPASYGAASSVGTFTVDADGRLTTAATVPIVIGSGEVTDNALTGTDINESTLILPGITSSPTGIDSLHYTTVTLTNTCGTLGTVSHVDIIAGPSGVECILPDPALLATPGFYSIVVTDANLVTLSPSGTNLLNGVNASMPSVGGPMKRINVERRSATEWYAEVISPMGGTDGGVGPEIVGITSSPTGIDSIHYTTVTLTNTCGTLGPVSHVNVIAGPSGVECILPDPALMTTPSFYSIAVIDANLVTLTPSAGQLLNGENAPMAAIRGPLSRIRVEWRDDVGWFTDLTSSVGYGEPVTSVCSSFGGNTNVSSSGSGTWIPHTLNCLIPANSITVGTVIDVCVGIRTLTGSVAPAFQTRIMANSIPIWQTVNATALYANTPGVTSRQCIGIMGAAVPSASSALYTGFPVDVFTSQYSILASTIGDPVLVNTTVDLLLTFESYFYTVETGINSLEQQYMDVRGSRFAN